MPTKRTRPLSASDAAPSGAVVLGAGGETDLEVAHVTDMLVDARDEEVRHQRFADGIRSLRVGGGTLNLNERLLMVIGGIVAPLGMIVLLLGWWGASRTPYLFEQVPYLISGGLFGLALVFLGAFFYFTHWMTELVKEHRRQSAAVIEAIQGLRDEVARQNGGSLTGAGAASPNGAGGTQAASRVSATASDEGTDATPLLATPQGTMAHRPDCAVVAGKPGLRSVTAADGLSACKLCDPYGSGD